MSECGYVTIPSLGWNCLLLRGTVCEVVWMYVFVDVSNVSSSCFKSRMSGRRNAGFILLILLVSLLIRRRSFLGNGTFTFAAAAAVAVYGNGECCRMSVSTFCGEGVALSIRSNSIVSGSVFVVCWELPVNTSIRCAV